MKYIGFSSIVILIIFSCSKKEEQKIINSKPNADFTYTDELDFFVLNSNSKDIDGDVLTYKWVSGCDTIKIVNSNFSSAYFNLPKLLNTEQLKICLTVNDGLLSDSIIKNITLPKETIERFYGLGIDLEDEHSNNVNYNWYYDQKNTGTYAFVNCGPTSVTMALKWAKPDFNKTPEDARNTYRSNGGWWYTNDIINYLDKYSIKNYTINILQIDSIQNQINSGNIAILCLDMYYIRSQEKDKWHIDKFYLTDKKGWGHFIVIKGYKIVDNEVYYEAYDPNSWGLKYNDGTLKGEDRYYRSEDLDSAVINWWNYAIIVSKSNLKSSYIGVDINKIIHKPGM
jgi:hypothetical protein